MPSGSWDDYETFNIDVGKFPEFETWVKQHFQVIGDALVFLAAFKGWLLAKTARASKLETEDVEAIVKALAHLEAETFGATLKGDIS